MADAPKIDQTRRGPLPLVIGVTGHRDIPLEYSHDYGRLKHQVFKFFRSQLLKRFPNTPIVVLSSLAEGADRLVARVVLELKNQFAEAGNTDVVRLVVPLPMEKALYEKDFQGPDSPPNSVEEFRTLCTKSERCFVVPTKAPVEKHDSEKYAAVRDLQYENAGAFIVRHSQILLALWDGIDTDLVGGTSRIVRFQLEGLPKQYAPDRTELDSIETAPVYHIMTRRTKPGHATNGRPYAAETLFPGGHERKLFDVIHRHIEDFNRDTVEQDAIVMRHIPRNMEHIPPERVLPEQGQEVSGLLRTIRGFYGLADALAIHFRSKTTGTLLRMLICVGLATIIFTLYAHFFLSPPDHIVTWTIWLVIPFIGLAFWLFYRSKRRNYETKYQDYRALAEGLRVQLFWRLANLDVLVADYYLQKHQTQLDWIRNAIRNWTLLEDVQSMPQHSREKETLKTILCLWVQGQATYFRRRVKQEHKKLKRLESWHTVLLVIGLAFLVLLVGFQVPTWWKGPFVIFGIEVKHVQEALVCLVVAFSVAAALVHTYTEKMVFSEHVKQYNRMAEIFARADKALSEILKIEDDIKSENSWNYEAREVIRKLGITALEENGDWVLLHRARPIDPPHVS